MTEKCRWLAEAQSSYRTMLEKMIRDAMHQSVIYKEQVRLNQAATNALMARLEAQKAMCDSAEKELHKKLKQRDEVEKQVRPEWEHARKRSRTDDTLFEERDRRLFFIYLELSCECQYTKKFLEEEHKTSEAGLSSNEELQHGEVEENLAKDGERFSTKILEHDKSIVAFEDYPIEDQIKRLEIGEEKTHNFQFPALGEPEIEEEEESRRQRGKGNVERWLQMLLENIEEELDPEDANENKTSRTDDVIKKLDEKVPQKDREERLNMDLKRTSRLSREESWEVGRRDC